MKSLRWFVPLSFVLCGLVWLTPSEARAATFTFIGADTGDPTAWSNAFNWSPHGLPGAGDDVTIDNFTVTTQGNRTVHGLTLAGANAYLYGGTLTVTGSNAAFNFTGGNIADVVTVDTSAKLNITDPPSGAADKIVTGTLNNKGTAMWTGAGRLLMGPNTPGINNSGSFNAQNDATITDSSNHQYGPGNFTNLPGGTFTKYPGTGTTTIDNVHLNNNGTVNVSSGTLMTQTTGNASTSSGNYNVAAGRRLVFSDIQVFSGTLKAASNATIDFAGGTHTFNGAVLGAGSLFRAIDSNFTPTVFNGTPVLNGTFQFEKGCLTADPGDMAFSGSGQVNWKGGTIGGKLTIPQGMPFNISGTDDKSVGGVLNNAGNATWSGTGPLLIAAEYTNAAFNNSGNFTAVNNATVMDAFNRQYGPGNFNNLSGGVFTKQTGTGITTFDNIHFNNAGTVNVNSGTLKTQTSGTTATSPGNFTVAANCHLIFTDINTFSGTLGTASGGTVDFSGGMQNFDHTTFAAGGLYRIINTGNGGTVVLDGTATLNGTLEFDTSGDSSGNGNLTLSGTGGINWFGGTIGGTLTIPGGMPVNINGTDDKTVSGVLNNGGNATWNGTGRILIAAEYTAAALNNSGNFTAVNNSTITDAFNHQYGPANFNNTATGVFTKQTGTGITTFDNVHFNNAGTVNANSGTLLTQTSGTPATSPGNFNAAANAHIVFTDINTFSGTFGTASGGTIDFSNGIQTFNNATLAAGGLYRIINSGSSPVKLDGTAALNGTLEFDSGGDSSSDGVLTLTGTGGITWFGGTIGGTLNVPDGMPVNINGTPDKTLSGVLNNGGNATWNGTGRILIAAEYTAAAFNNSGNFTAVNNSTITDAFNHQYGPANFNNTATGVFTKQTGTGTSIFDNVHFNNAGTTNVNSGTVRTQTTGTVATSPGKFNAAANAHMVFTDINSFSGTFSTASGGTIDFSSGTQTFNHVTLAAGGLYRVINSGNTPVALSGTAALNGTFQFDTTGASGGTGVLTFSGTGKFNINGGSVGGTVNIPKTIPVAISGSAVKDIAAIFNCAGNTTWSGTGALRINAEYTAAAFNNSGVFLATNDAVMTDSFNHQYGPALFNNLAGGTFTKQGTAGVTTLDNIKFTNSGTVNINSGTLNSTLAYNQTAGMTNLSNSKLTDAAGININGGTLAGAGTITGNVISKATVSPGHSPGAITISGNYTQTSTGTLSIQIGGATAATQYDQLKVTGTATLAGTLAFSLINGYVPPANQQFQVMAYGSRSGSFGIVKVVATTAGRYFTVSYAATAVVVTTNIDTTPPTVAIVTPAEGAFVASLPSISGTAADSGGSKLQRVDVQLSRNKVGGGVENWNGTAWVTPVTSLPTALANGPTSSSWSRGNGLPTGANLAPGTYFIKAIAYDGALNAVADTTTITVVLAPFISGRVTNSANSQPMAGVRITRKNGAGSVRTVTDVNGNYAFSSVPVGNYIISAAASSFGFSPLSKTVSITSTSTNFPGTNFVGTFDRTAPTVAITIPADGASITAFPAHITGTAADSGSGITGVTLLLYRWSDGSFWNGTAWGSTAVYLPTTISGTTSVNWSSSGSLPSGSTLTNGDCTIYAFAVDGAGNSGSTENTVTIKGAGPIALAMSASAATLSSGSARAAMQSITLTFTSALNVDSAADLTNYDVLVNGTTVTPESVGVSDGGRGIILSLPDGSLHTGDSVTVFWHGLRDSRNRTVAGSRTLTVQ